MAFKKLAKRVGAGAVLIPVVLLITYKGGLVFAGFVALLAALGGSEFVKIAGARGPRVSGPVTVVGSTAIALTFYFGSLETAALVFTIVVLAALMERLARGGVEEYLGSVSLTLAGIFYTGWLLGFFILLRQFPGESLRVEPAAVADTGRSLVFLVLVLAWSNDTGAYFTGSSIGRHKLMPGVSPSKTVEGTLGGIACCVAAALISRATFASFLGQGEAVIAGVLIGAACIVGDLVESMLKRSAGVKDSSNLIPGHGGLLDRFDSLLFAGPVFYFYARLVLSGVPV